MVSLNENAITLVDSTTGVDMKTAAKENLFTVPPGKVFYCTHVVIRDPSASMAGGVDYDIGTGANCDTWRQAVDLSSMTTANTDFMVITGADVTKYSEEAAAGVWGIKVITGTTAACTATIDTFGYFV